MPAKTFHLADLDRQIHRLVLGTAHPVFSDQCQADQMFDAYVSLGGNCLDTAPNYLDAELTIGSWLSRRRNRQQVVIATKGGHHKGGRQRVTPEDIRQDLSESLSRLGTDYIDLYVLHRDDMDQPVGPILECLAAEQSAGRILAYGASNWSIPRLEEAAECAASHALNTFSVSSPQFSLAFPNEPVWPNCLTARDSFSRRWYAESGMPLFGWSPLGSGFFSNSFRPREEMSSRERERSINNPSEVERVYYSENNFRRLSRANELAAQRGVSSSQIALAWALNQPLQLCAVAAPTSLRQLHELFDAFDIDLTPSETAWLELAHDRSDALPV
jgi:aryl-alcohol dehydrogenase-like predicted oxidoreductase